MNIQEDRNSPREKEDLTGIHRIIQDTGKIREKQAPEKEKFGIDIQDIHVDFSRIEDSGTRTNPEKRFNRDSQDETGYQKERKKGYRNQKICIDIQDIQDRGPDTEKPPKISSYKFTMAGFQEDRKTIIFYPGQEFNPLSLEKKKIPGKRINSPPSEGWQAQPVGVVKRAVQTLLKINPGKQNFNKDTQIENY